MRGKRRGKQEKGEDGDEEDSDTGDVDTSFLMEDSSGEERYFLSSPLSAERKQRKPRRMRNVHLERGLCGKLLSLSSSSPPKTRSLRVLSFSRYLPLLSDTLFMNVRRVSPLF